MIAEANLVRTVWNGDTLVALLRAWTDWVYVCYLADIMVAAEYQRSGIGRLLVADLRARLGDRVQLVAVAAPTASGFYESIGFEKSDRTYILRRKQ